MSDNPTPSSRPNRPAAPPPARRPPQQPQRPQAQDFAPAARKFRQADLIDLAESKFTGLDEEITMLRVFIRGVIEQSSSAANLTERIEVLHALSLATASLTRMARTKNTSIPAATASGSPRKYFRSPSPKSMKSGAKVARKFNCFDLFFRGTNPNPERKISWEYTRSPLTPGPSPAPSGTPSGTPSGVLKSMY